MRGPVAAMVVVFSIACGGPTNGLKSSGMSTSQLQEGCDREHSQCNGLGYDDVGLVVGGAAALALVVIAKLVQR